MSRDVFISYATAGKAVADAVCAELESVHHVRCWIAPRDIPAGVPWVRASLDALDKSRVVVSILGSDEDPPASVDAEIQRALRQGTSVVPLRIEATTPAETDITAPHRPDALSAPLRLRISRVAENVKALLEKLPAQTVVGIPAAAPGVAMPGRGRPGAPVGPQEAGGPSSWLIAAVFGAALVLAVAVGIYFGNQTTLPVSDSGEAPGEASQTAATALPPSNPAAATAGSELSDPDPLAGAFEERAASPEAQATRPSVAVGPSASPQPDRATPPPEASPTERTVSQPPAGTATATSAASNTPTATPVEATAAPRSAPAPGKPAEPVAAPARVTPGTLLIDFVNSLPDGSLEVEVDGRVRWSEQLRLNRPAGVLTRLKLSRVSEQLGSKIEVTPGDHKITVTVLTAEGEVRDYSTTVLRVTAARPMTLRIRFSRFRSRLQVASAAG